MCPRFLHFAILRVAEFTTIHPLQQHRTRLPVVFRIADGPLDGTRDGGSDHALGLPVLPGTILNRIAVHKHSNDGHGDAAHVFEAHGLVEDCPAQEKDGDGLDVSNNLRRERSYLSFAPGKENTGRRLSPVQKFLGSALTPHRVGERT
jgi:hypothetical protein